MERKRGLHSAHHHVYIPISSCLGPQLAIQASGETLNPGVTHGGNSLTDGCNGNQSACKLSLVQVEALLRTWWLGLHKTHWIRDRIQICWVEIVF